MADTTAPAPAAPAPGVAQTTPKDAAPTGNKAAAPPQDEFITINGQKMKSKDAWAEIERGRQSVKFLSEAQKARFEAAKQAKEFEALVGEVKTKKQAQKLIERLGLSKDEAVEIFGRYVYEAEVLPRELDPKERRIRELEAEAKARKDQEERQAKERQEQELNESTRREETRLREEITKIIQAKGIPATRLAVRRFANYLASYAAAGADIPAERAADLVMDDYRQEFGELFDEASAEQLESFLGKQRWQALAKKVSGWALAKARGGANIPVKDAIPSRTTKPANPGEKMSPHEFQKMLRGLK